MKVLYPVCTIFVLKIDIPMNILFLVGGLLLILLGANGLTDGAASVAKRFHIPSIVIGLTIVAFGTSAPELTVSISSALKGSADIAIGNVVGSNTFNTLMIVGCTALFAPIAITRNTLKREIPLCILSSFALLICANDVLLDSSGENILSITDGLLLLCFLPFSELYFCHCKKGWKYEGTGKGALTGRRRNQAVTRVEVRPIHSRRTCRPHHRR